VLAMSDTRKRINELDALSERAKEAGDLREGLSLPEDVMTGLPFSGIRMKDVFNSRKAASDKLQNMRDEETEDLIQRRKLEKAMPKVKKMASGGSVSARGDGIAQRGKTKGRFV